MRASLKSYLLLALMLSAAGAALSVRPTQRIADEKRPIQLEKMVLESFGEWREIKQSAQQIVNPQEKLMLDQLYSQTLSKSYINAAGYRVMLSIAYGDDQSRDLGVHRPEVCYVAQGFQLSEQKKTTLQIDGKPVPAMHIQTRLGSRIEPVTYWIRVGDKLVRGNLELGFARLSYGLRGQIADGLLFRVSSLDSNSATAYAIHEEFATELTKAVQVADKPSLLGALANTSN